MKTENVKYTVRFEAAHSLPNTPEDHKCHRIHGHSYLVTVCAPADAPTGLASAVEALGESLGHCYLNDVEGLENPTSENLARWLCTKLSGFPLREVRVGENADAHCIYRPQGAGCE